MDKPTGDGGGLALDAGSGFRSNPGVAQNPLCFPHRPLKRPSPAIESPHSPTCSSPKPSLQRLHTTTEDDDDRAGGTGLKRRINEMDFFSVERRKGASGAGGKTIAAEEEDSKGDEDRLQGDTKGTMALWIKKEDLSINTRLHLHTTNTGSDQSMVDDGVSSNEEDHAHRHHNDPARAGSGNNQGSDQQLAAMKAELARMVEENQRLRGMLSQATNNYNALHMHVMSIMQKHNNRDTHHQQRSPSPPDAATHNHEVVADKMDVAKLNHHGASSMVPRQFLDPGPMATDEPSNSSTEVGSPLRPGSSSTHNNNNTSSNAEVASMDYRLIKTSLSGNNINDMIPFDHDKAVAVAVAASASAGDQMMIGDHDSWIPNKLPKLKPSKNPAATAAAVEQAQEATMRKARVSVRARSEAPMITDGCQWRKYGQKMAKGNPCPRAYYRCTMAAGCPVRKQVQRCAEDRSILITTYEGTHNHPLPPAAVAMASTTSAAASMLLSGSMSSADGIMNPNFLARTLLPCSSNMATISASAPFPTVTLDLTTAPNPLQYQRPTATPGHPSLNSAQFPAGVVPPPFASVPVPAAAASGPTAAAPHPPLPQIFGQTLYGSTQSKFSGHHMSTAEQHPKSSPSPFPAISASQPPPQTSFVDTVSAAITSDPNFTAALAAAISSIIGGQQQQTVGAAAASLQNSGGSHSKASSSEELTR